MIIALGESIVALGIGAAGLPLTWDVVTAAVLGVAVAAALWWAYFDVVALVAQRKLAEATGVARAALARDSYSYLHLPMVAGIVLFALGVKKTLVDVDDPLETVPAVGLCGGVALYLLAHVAFRLRNVRTLSRRRLVTAFVLLAFLPVAREVSASVTCRRRGRVRRFDRLRGSALPRGPRAGTSIARIAVTKVRPGGQPTRRRNVKTQLVTEMLETSAEGHFVLENPHSSRFAWTARS